MINREQELHWLTSHLTRDERQLFVMYGRRRVGKTTLVTEAHDIYTPTDLAAVFSSESGLHN